MVGNSIKEVLHHDYNDVEHLQSVAAIPHLIENGIYITSERNTGSKDIDRFDYYVCGLKIGGEDYTVKMVISEKSNGKRYYDHNLVEIEKGKLLDHISGQAVITGFGTTPGTKPTTNTERKVNSLVSLLQTNPQEIASAEARMREILDEVKREKGYTADNDYQGSLAFNGAAPSSNAYFDTREELADA